MTKEIPQPPTTELKQKEFVAILSEGIPTSAGILRGMIKARVLNPSTCHRGIHTIYTPPNILTAYVALRIKKDNDLTYWKDVGRSMAQGEIFRRYLRTIKETDEWGNIYKACIKKNIPIIDYPELRPKPECEMALILEAFSEKYSDVNTSQEIIRQDAFLFVNTCKRLFKHWKRKDESIESTKNILDDAKLGNWDGVKQFVIDAGNKLIRDCSDKQDPIGTDFGIALLSLGLSLK